jgi:hypothetical protein
VEPRDYIQADQAFGERTSPKQVPITGKEILHQAGLHTYPNSHPQLYTNRAAITTSNSCYDQNQPDGHQPVVYIEMEGKVDSTKINQQEQHDEETKQWLTSIPT